MEGNEVIDVKPDVKLFVGGEKPDIRPLNKIKNEPGLLCPTFGHDPSCSNDLQDLCGEMKETRHERNLDDIEKKPIHLFLRDEQQSQQKSSFEEDTFSPDFKPVRTHWSMGHACSLKSKPETIDDVKQEQQKSQHNETGFPATSEGEDALCIKMLHAKLEAGSSSVFTERHKETESMEHSQSEDKNLRDQRNYPCLRALQFGNLQSTPQSTQDCTKRLDTEGNPLLLDLRTEQSMDTSRSSGCKPFMCAVCSKGFMTRSSLKSHKCKRSDGKRFTCDGCDKKFVNKWQLKQHKFMHSCGKLYTCDVCDEGFVNRSQLRQHRVTHSDVRPFTCDLCNKGFKSKSLLRKHQLRHFSEKLFKCDMCNRRFSCRSEVVKHMIKYLPVKPFMCDLCQIHFSHMASLIRHKVYKHNSVQGAMNSFICDVCNKGFASESYLNKHKKIHFAIKSFTCDVCDKRFLSMSYLRQHRRVHLTLKPFTCDVCYKSFKLKSYLKKHRLRHSSLSGQFYTCEVCQMKLKSKSGLAKHMNVHLPIKLFTCDVCNKEVKSKTSLKEHKAIHFAMKTFSCDVCNKGFILKSYLLKHKSKVHSALLFTCDVCNKGFKSRPGLKQHKKIHFAVKQFSCDLCFNKMFACKSNLIKHKQEVHSTLKLFKCNVCDKGFKRIHDLKRHTFIHLSQSKKGEKNEGKKAEIKKRNYVEDLEHNTCILDKFGSIDNRAIKAEQEYM